MRTSCRPCTYVQPTLLPTCCLSLSLSSAPLLAHCLHMLPPMTSTLILLLLGTRENTKQTRRINNKILGFLGRCFLLREQCPKKRIYDFLSPTQSGAIPERFMLSTFVDFLPARQRPRTEAPQRAPKGALGSRECSQKSACSQECF